MTVSNLTPVAAGERLDQLDILRGFALFGILLVNFEFFLNPMQSVVLASELDPGSTDGITRLVVAILAEGKFYALFSMLFGAGFALMMERANARAGAFWPVYLRRLLGLLAIGLAHMLLVWSGDILVVYAVVAFVMVLLFRRTPVSRLPKWAVVFLLLPTLVMVLLTGMMALAPPESLADLPRQFSADLEQARTTSESAAAIIASGSFGQAVAQRLDDMLFMFESFLFWIPPILGYFLLGRWLIATGRLSRLDAHAGFHRKALVLGLVVGLPLCIAGAWLMRDQNLIVMTPQLALASSLIAVGAPLLAFGYLALILLNRHRLDWLAPAGRMALTNYLCQSLFWTWMIHGYGLGLGPEIDPWLTPILAIGFFALQIVVSHLWLARFRFGPAEWLWRSLTYLKIQPISKAVA